MKIWKTTQYHLSKNACFSLSACFGFCYLVKLLGTYFNLSIPNLSTSGFKLAKPIFLAKSDVSTSVAFFKSAFAP